MYPWHVFRTIGTIGIPNRSRQRSSRCPRRRRRCCLTSCPQCRKVVWETPKNFQKKLRTMPRSYSENLRLGNSVEAKAETLGSPSNSFLMHPCVEFVIMEADLDHPEKTPSDIAKSIYEYRVRTCSFEDIAVFETELFQPKKSLLRSRYYGRHESLRDDPNNGCEGD